MTLSRTEINARSDEKRGVKLKAFKLSLELIAEIEQLAEKHNIPQNKLIAEAIEAFKQQNP